MAELTKSQREFVEYYLLTLNPFEAAILAGYPRDDAVKHGKALLNSKRVVAKIRERVENQSKTLYVTRSYIMDKLLKIIEFSMEEEAILDKEGQQTGHFKLRDCSSALKALVSLSKLVEGCEKMSQNNDVDMDVENLNIEKI